MSFMYELVRAADNMLKMASAFDTRLLVSSNDCCLTVVYCL